MTLAVFWIALILAAPWLMAEKHFLTSASVYQGFSVVCHQNPERSYYFHGYPMGVCSRCISIYAGTIIGLLLYPFLRDLQEEDFPPRWILIVAAIPTLIDFTGGVLGLFANTFFSRSLTGIIFGSVAAFYITPGFVSALNEWRGVLARPRTNC